LCEEDYNTPIMRIYNYEKVAEVSSNSTRALAPRKLRIALLQGPVGPFFNRLKVKLEQNNFDVHRICFNFGDALFSSGSGKINFRGGIKEWKKWFADFIALNQLDLIVLFGAERGVHRVAREVASVAGVSVISMEEGYLRPGYVTAELGGNNACSPLAGLLPPDDFVPKNETTQTPVDFKGFRKMFLYGAAYYTARSLFTFGKRRMLFHRSVSLHQEAFCWTRNIYRRVTSGSHNSALIQDLLEHFCGKYYLVPLQVPADGQMQLNALGWDIEKLISETITSFANSAPKCSRLIFKIHPMERGHSTCKIMISRMAASLGVSDRVDVIDTGSLGLLTRHAAGMITINSTSGLSAIHHGIPLLVIGRAIYANEKLAYCGRGKPNFDLFWNADFVAPGSLREKYLLWLKESALIPGDFYSSKGIDLACENISARLKCVKF
jgi:capsular polysaccharide export protein